MTKVGTVLERGGYYRERAHEVRTIARKLPEGPARQTLLAIGDDYDRLAEAQDKMILSEAAAD